MTAILFAGDPHGNFRAIVEAAVKERPRPVVLLGDYDLKMPLDQEMKPVLQAGIPVLVDTWQSRCRPGKLARPAIQQRTR